MALRVRWPVAALVGLLYAAPVFAQQTITARGASIRIGGRLHAQYASSTVGAASDGFFIRRARITADVTLNDFIDGRLQPEFSGGSPDLKDAYVRFRFSPAFQLSMGQFKQAFDLFELSSSTDLSIIERDGRVGGVDACSGVGGVCSLSRFTQKLAFSDRDTGLRVEGSQGRLQYLATITNGAGANENDDNDAKSFAGRVGVAVSEGVTVGAQLALHDYESEDDDAARAHAWSADVQVGEFRDGLLLQAAVVGGENWRNPDASGDPSPFLAFQAVTSWYAPLTGERLTGWEPLLRVSYGDPDTDVADDGGLVLTPGLMLYVTGRNKIGFNVDVWSPQDGDTEVSLKIQSFLYF